MIERGKFRSLTLINWNGFFARTFDLDELVIHKQKKLNGVLFIPSALLLSQEFQFKNPKLSG